MKWYGRVLEYAFYTAIMTFAYYPVVIPWLIFVGHMSMENVERYLWQGYLIDLGVAYPIGKLLVRVSPKIKEVCGFDLELLQNNLKTKFKCLWEDITNI